MTQRRDARGRFAPGPHAAPTPGNRPRAASVGDQPVTDPRTTWQAYRACRTDQAFTCARCQQPAIRGGNPLHTCPAPGLITVDPATRAVLDACRDAGGRPLLVGGAVRDALMDGTREPKDIDVEVYGTDADTLAAALTRTGARVDEVGKSFGVLKVTHTGRDYDVSLPRTESKTGTGHRGFAIAAEASLDPLAAFARRDYTINAIGWDPATGALLDPYGGTADLEAGILRHTSPAFADDPLRVLRGVGFAGRFGFDMAPETIAECQRIAETYPEIARERVWTEFEKIATRGRHPGKALDLLHRTGWEQHFPALAAIRGVPQDARHHPEGSVETHTALTADAAARIAERDGLTGQDRAVLVLAAISHDLGKCTHTQIHDDGRITSHGHAEAGAETSGGFLAGIGAPDRIRRHVAVLVREHMAATTGAPGGPSKAAVRRLARRLAGADGNGPDLAMWARVVEADNAGRGPGSRPSPARAWLEVAAALPAGGSPSTPLLRGEHLIAAGLRPGPGFTPILADALTAQDDGDFADEDGARAWLAARLRGSEG